MELNDLLRNKAENYDKIETMLSNLSEDDIYKLMTMKRYHQIQRGVNQSVKIFAYIFERISSGKKLQFIRISGLAYVFGKDMLEVIELIHKGLSCSEWIELLQDQPSWFVSLGSSNSEADDPTAMLSLKYILESVRDPTTRLSLLQGSESPHHCPAINFARRRRDCLEVMIDCTAISDRLSFYQTPCNEYQAENCNNRVSEFEILKLKRSTFAHYILTQDTYIEWKDSKLRCIIKSVDQKDVYHLLLTQDGEGNTLSHVVWDEKRLMELLREVQCPELIFTLLSAQNSDGDTPFHKVHVDSFEKWLDMITPAQLEQILFMQNGRGDTIIHHYINNRGRYHLNRHSRMHYCSSLLHSLKQLNQPIDKAFLLLLNSRGRNALQEFMASRDMERLDSADHSYCRTLREFLEAIDSPHIISRLLIQKDEFGNTPMHLICRYYQPCVRTVLNLIGTPDLVDVLSQTNCADDTIIHVIAQYHPTMLLDVLKMVEEDKMHVLIKTQNSCGDSPIHVLVRQVAFIGITQKVLIMLPVELIETLSMMRNKVEATPLHLSLAYSNKQVFTCIVETVGGLKSLRILLDDTEFPPNLFGAVCSPQVTEELLAKETSKMNSDSCFYLSTMPTVSEQTAHLLQRYHDQKLQKTIQEAKDVSDIGKSECYHDLAKSILSRSKRRLLACLFLYM